MPLNPPEFPVTLTDKSWQKEKGMLAKLAGETGLGSELKKLEEAVGKMDWIKVNPAMSYKTEELLDQAIEGAKTEWQEKYPAILRAATDSKAVAFTTAKKYEVTKGVPQSAVTAAKNVGLAAEKFLEEMHGYPQKLMQEFESRRAKFGLQKVELQKIGGNMFAEAKVAVKTVKQTGVFDTKIWNKFRTLGTQVPKLEWAKAYHAQAATIFSMGPEKVPKAQVPSHISKVEHLIAELEKIAPK